MPALKVLDLFNLDIVCRYASLVTNQSIWRMLGPPGSGKALLPAASGGGLSCLHFKLLLLFNTSFFSFLYHILIFNNKYILQNSAGIIN